MHADSIDKKQSSTQHNNASEMHNWNVKYYAATKH